MMTEKEDRAWQPLEFMEQLQSMSESATEKQMDLFRRWMEAGNSTQLPDMTRGMGLGSAMFKTRVQSGGRISIPDAEREALDIEEGDIVQAHIIPIRHGGNNE